jgi:prepilin-type N-terminal cleavage/methylation domain-containing protein
MRAARGFSLIELIMIIVVLGVASAFLTTTFTQLPRSLDVSEGAQTASQLAQQCSERVLARRRSGAGWVRPDVSGIADATLRVHRDRRSGLPPVVGWQTCKRVT